MNGSLKLKKGEEGRVSMIEHWMYSVSVVLFAAVSVLAANSAQIWAE